MELAVHMKNIKTNEERVKKVNGVDASDHEPVKDFYYGSEWAWIGTEPFCNVADKVKYIGRGYYKETKMKHFNEVQMINDNYYIINDLTVREKYPILFKEVCEHDRELTSSWYSLSDEAYEEYQEWCKII